MTFNLENRVRRARGGFTLIELLVVIAIIGVLAAVVLVSLNTARMRGRDAKRLADLDAVRLALEVYADQNGSVYPADAGSPGTEPDLASFNTITGALVTAQLLSATPTDPVNGRDYVGQLNAAANATSYILGADLESPTAACDTDYDGDDVDGTGSACTASTANCDGDDTDGVDYCICQGTACS